MRIPINCDMGESFGIYRMGDDEGLMQYIHVANVACGFHASDPVVMQATVNLAKKNNVKVGAHPSLPDLQGFGRREMKMAPEELTAHLIYQIGALKGFLDRAGMPLNHIKPHGALYAMASRLEEVASAVCDVAESFQVPLFGLSGTLHEEISLQRGIDFKAEFYADLEYNDEGQILITREHEAADVEKTIEKVKRAVEEGKVYSVNQKDLEIKINTICIHSDTPNALELAEKITITLHEMAT